MSVKDEYRDSTSQDNTSILKIVDVPAQHLADATDIAMRFSHDYTDGKLGIYHGVSYGCIIGESYEVKFYVYRTKTMIVVRWAGE